MSCSSSKSLHERIAMAELKSIGRAKQAAQLREEKESELKCKTNDDYYSIS